MSKSIEMVRVYVLVDGEGKWLSRPFGSANAAYKAGKRMADGYYTILEVTTAFVTVHDTEF